MSSRRLCANLSKVNLTDDEASVLKELLRNGSEDVLPDFLRAVLGDRWLMFYDVFQGKEIKVPSIEETKEAVVEARVYCFSEEERSHGKDPYDGVAMWLGKSQKDAVEMVEGVQRVLGRFDMEEHMRTIANLRNRKSSEKKTDKIGLSQLSIFQPREHP